MKNNLYTLCYAAILGMACSVLLTATKNFTEPYRAANARADEIRHILAALKVPLKADQPSKRLLDIFNRVVVKRELGDMVTYEYVPSGTQGRVEAIALRFSGPGLWGPIKGLLALESDAETIRGVTFYEHEETPGLGGKISSASFREQFEGKSIVNETGKFGIVIRKGDSQLARNSVHGITGATMTCNKVEAMLNTAIQAFIEAKDIHGQ
ncbi:MAG: FMN-binding protein [Phycisphaerales bacterium]|nr:MAG: FMN-binding protein [Phycisphaerales bacterium]